MYSLSHDQWDKKKLYNVHIQRVCYSHISDKTKIMFRSFHYLSSPVSSYTVLFNSHLAKSVYIVETTKLWIFCAQQAFVWDITVDVLGAAISSLFHIWQKHCFYFLFLWLWKYEIWNEYFHINGIFSGFFCVCHFSTKARLLPFYPCTLQ